MKKAFRLVGTGAAIWSRTGLHSTQGIAAPVYSAVKTQLQLFKVCAPTACTSAVLTRHECAEPLIAALTVM